MTILWTILYLVITILIMIGLLMLGRKFVFSKVKVNKWIILAITIVLFIGQLIIQPNNVFIQYLFIIPAVWFFLWFMEINTYGVPKGKEKKIVIKPKAKPNRAKHLNKDNK